ncbi:glycosyltransferase family 2 protein [Pedobacter chitinilyticus]|uniref:Glycosyltransferase family 2 protein n=1 Tax=Pedobacter chitinilyticus TaxID=2233776 RepID=A0A443YUM7_9SPHI|nr:glycosyltransferase family 2 protein [Pedobacter chitinilyticus]RWU07563.1 glycosyltransferase family 2 protein [Pedobacter chitinilyticus]
MDNTGKNPIVTVFMAVYNGEKYIKEAIESVLTQSYRDFELLIINDGSTDKTLDVIAQFKDPRIRLLHNDGNRGLTYTRNHGVKEARGEYFAILDSDDIAMPNRLKIQVDYMNANADVAICGGQAVLIDGSSKEIRPYKVHSGDSLSHWLVLHNVFINSTLMIKTSVMREMGGYRDMAPAEDYDLSFRIGLKYRVANISDTFVFYREHGNNISKVQTEKLNNAERRIIEHIHSSLKISTDKAFIKTHHSILKYDFEASAISEFELFLKALRKSNHLNKYYPISIFNRFLFDTWFKILKVKKEKNIIYLYFKSPFFKWSFVTFGQLSKVFRKTLFS